MPAYSDVPFITALLIKSGIMLFGDNLLGTRAFFIALGTAIPFIIYWLVLPLSNKKTATIALTLSLCTPAISGMGLLAVPDVPLLFFSALAIGFFERAIRTGEKKYWLLLGFAGMLGFCTHYRFIFVPFSLFIFLLITPSRRKLLAHPPALMAGALALIGLIPILWFNIKFDWQGISFHFSNRHPGEFNPRGLLQPAVQSLIVTPVIYIFLVSTAIWGIKHKTEAVKLFSTIGLCYMLIFAIAAPWADQRSSSAHWPLTGYLPLLALLPLFISSEFKNSKLPTLLIAATGLIGSCLLAASFYINANFHLLSIPQQEHFTNKYDGYDEAAERIEKLLEPDMVMLSDNYYAGSLIAFWSKRAETMYYFNGDKAIRDGRFTQINVWRRSINDIPASQNTLIIIERDKIYDDEYNAYLNLLCQNFSELKALEDFTQFKADRWFTLYSGIKNNEVNNSDDCDQPLRFYIDEGYPVKGSTISGEIIIKGWSSKNKYGIKSISLIADDQEVSIASLGRKKPINKVFPDVSDPNHPNIGFDLKFDTQSIKNGAYIFKIKVQTNDGMTHYFKPRHIYIDN